MMSPSRRRWLLRIWMTLSILFFAVTCADRARPYLKNIAPFLKSIAGARDVPAGAHTVPAGARDLPAAQRAHGGLRLASWNLQFLDVPGRGPDGRSLTDYAALTRYADLLAADVIAVQEVASVEALKLVFPPHVYAYHLAQTGGSQRSGFVYKKQLGARPYPDLQALALTGLRAGADLAVQVNGRELRLLSVHLKAFCVTGSLTREGKDCRKLSAQIPVLESWIDARAKEGGPFVVLGDFNRALGEPDDALFRDLDDGEPKSLRLVRASVRTHSTCRGKRQYAVDHMLLGGAAGGWLSSEGLAELAYQRADLEAGVRLSDHCPIQVTLAGQSVR